MVPSVTIGPWGLAMPVTRAPALIDVLRRPQPAEVQRQRSSARADLLAIADDLERLAVEQDDVSSEWAAIADEVKKIRERR